MYTTSHQRTCASAVSLRTIKSGIFYFSTNNFYDTDVGKTGVLQIIRIAVIFLQVLWIIFGCCFF